MKTVLKCTNTLLAAAMFLAGVSIAIFLLYTACQFNENLMSFAQCLKHAGYAFLGLLAMYAVSHIRIFIKCCLEYYY